MNLPQYPHSSHSADTNLSRPKESFTTGLTSLMTFRARTSLRFFSASATRPSASMSPTFAASSRRRAASSCFLSRRAPGRRAARSTCSVGMGLASLAGPAGRVQRDREPEPGHDPVAGPADEPQDRGLVGPDRRVQARVFPGLVGRAGEAVDVAQAVVILHREYPTSSSPPEASAAARTIQDSPHPADFPSRPFIRRARAATSARRARSIFSRIGRPEVLDPRFLLLLEALARTVDAEQLDVRLALRGREGAVELLQVPAAGVAARAAQADDRDVPLVPHRTSPMLALRASSQPPASMILSPYAAWPSTTSPRPATNEISAKLDVSSRPLILPDLQQAEGPAGDVVADVSPRPRAVVPQGTDRLAGLEVQVVVHVPGAELAAVLALPNDRHGHHSTSPGSVTRTVPTTKSPGLPPAASRSAVARGFQGTPGSRSFPSSSSHMVRPSLRNTHSTRSVSTCRYSSSRLTCCPRGRTSRSGPRGGMTIPITAPPSRRRGRRARPRRTRTARRPDPGRPRTSRRSRRRSGRARCPGRRPRAGPTRRRRGRPRRTSGSRSS